MKIDLIIGNLQSGGAERVVSILGNHFAEKYDTRVITFKDVEKYKLDKRVTRLRFHKNLPVFNYTLVRALIYLMKYYAKPENRPDIISSHIDRVGLATIPVAKFYKIPIIVSEHNNHSSKKITLLKKFLWNFLYKYADAVTVLTKYDLPFFRKRNKRVLVIHNPSSFKAIKTQNTHREKSILAIGSLDRYQHKGFDNLLYIAKKVFEQKKDWKLKIVGEGEKGKHFLQKKVEELNITESVEFLGFRSDIANLLQHSSIYILSSRFEGLPMVLIEATSQGVACIAYDCISGPSDIIDHGKTGILVENQNKKEMARQLISLMENPDLRIEIGTNAIAASKKFDVSKIGEQWDNLFSKVLENREVK
ncbi:glycosyltransferase family 4 protein [Muricauda sp. 334s03]|uniref:Glycosyltransferase family 4 protein n=1 Tax=Flagellimonas yonaguniensis TaxID=3031325 RepID=A0ABT5Y1V0_9FLAO|nr:glycosyltransferase family 4 protein [[Muricauda] yonaguniensis]MDF0717423.1 glycosyltransferase family 4 protein [[Muricauda] yonaguniensis]